MTTYALKQHLIKPMTQATIADNAVIEEVIRERGAFEVIESARGYVMRNDSNAVIEITAERTMYTQPQLWLAYAGAEADDRECHRAIHTDLGKAIAQATQGYIKAENERRVKHLTRNEPIRVHTRAQYYSHEQLQTHRPQAVDYMYSMMVKHQHMTRPDLVTEFVAEYDYHRSTAYRAIAALYQFGYVELDEIDNVTHVSIIPPYYLMPRQAEDYKAEAHRQNPQHMIELIDTPDTVTRDDAARALVELINRHGRQGVSVVHATYRLMTEFDMPQPHASHVIKYVIATENVKRIGDAIQPLLIPVMPTDTEITVNYSDGDSKEYADLYEYDEAGQSINSLYDDACKHGDTKLMSYIDTYRALNRAR